MSASSERRRVLLGVTGGIAAFKAILLLRRLQEQGFEVRVVMTPNAARFVGEATFHALSGHPVVMDVWQLDRTRGGELHVELAAWADAVIVYPATSHFTGALAAGLNDDLLQLCCSCSSGPVLLCPAMHTEMARTAQHQAAEMALEAAGLHVLSPETGRLASGEVGFGRLPEPEAALAELQRLLGEGDLLGRTVLVTAGPTREAFDPVRFLSNPSTGRMGYAVARVAWERGARVILISGPTALPTPHGVERVDIESAAELAAAVKEHFVRCDVLVMTAAVADFTPRQRSPQKIKKGDGPLSLALRRTEDILAGLGGQPDRGHRVLVGFAMETADLVARAQAKLEGKRLDLIVANDLGVPGAGFGTPTNVVTLLDRSGLREDLPQLSKIEVAEQILDRVVAMLE